MMLRCGAEIHRVEDTLTRMGQAYGAVRTDIFVITSSIVVTIAFPDGVELTQTRRIVSIGPTDFFSDGAFERVEPPVLQGAVEPGRIGPCSGTVGEANPHLVVVFGQFSRSW